MRNGFFGYYHLNKIYSFTIICFIFPVDGRKFLQRIYFMILIMFSENSTKKIIKMKQNILHLKIPSDKYKKKYRQFTRKSFSKNKKAFLKMYLYLLFEPNLK